MSIAEMGGSVMGSNAIAGGGGGGFDFNSLLSDPNFLQMLGNAGSSLSQGDPVGVALNPAEGIGRIQDQKATQQLLQQLLGQQNKTTGVGTSQDPTPIGQAGPDSVVTKKTADGTTVTTNTPSEQNLNTFGSNVPAESQTPGPVQGQPAAQGGVGNSPFFQALLGN